MTDLTRRESWRFGTAWTHSFLRGSNRSQWAASASLSISQSKTTGEMVGSPAGFRIRDFRFFLSGTTCEMTRARMSPRT